MDDSDLGLLLKNRWRYGAACILLAALCTTPPWHFAQRLSRPSLAASLIALTVVAAIVCIVLISAVPLWLAWITDIRMSSRIASRAPSRQVDLTGPRQAMSAIRQTSQSKVPDLHPTSEPVSAALAGLLSLIMRDFVNAWHSPLVSGSLQHTELNPSHHFPTMVEKTIRDSLLIFFERASAIDLPHMGMCKLLPILIRHMKLFEEAEAEWRKSPSSAEFAEGIEGDLFLAALYNDGVLHPAVANIASPDTKLTELAHLRRVSQRITKHVLSEREARSPGVNIVVRELIACTVLWPTIDALSDPDFLNALLEEKADAALQEQKMVNKLRDALDKQGTVTQAPKPATTTPSTTSASRKKKDDRSSEISYDSFMDNIGQSTSILEARRTRNGLLQQIRKTKAALEEDEGYQYEPKKKALQVYLQRLQAALQAVDRRMAQLGTAHPFAPEKINSGAKVPPDQFEGSLVLQDILNSSSAISHFMEFSERRDCSILVQFWLSVNTFKNPLELADSDSEDERIAQKDPTTSPSSWQYAHEQEATTLMEDLKFIVETYYRSEKLRKVIKAKYIQIAEDYVRRYDSMQIRPSNSTIQQARKSVIRAQKQVYDELVDEHWPMFRLRTIWHQVVEDIFRERAQQAPTVTSSSSFFLDHKDIARDPAPRPSTSRAVSHAHLFGMSDEGEEESPNKSLFGEDKDGKGLRHLMQTTSTVDQLMGGKGATFEGVNGRDPLFREALFDDEEGVHEERVAPARGKEAFVHVEKVDALESILAFIIEEDVPSDRLTADHSITTTRRRSSVSVKSRQQSPVLEDDNASAALMTMASTDQVLPSALASNRTTSRARMDEDIKRLSDQEELLGTMIRKAELTGSSEKGMRLLHKSKNTIARELRELRFQQATFAEKQEEDPQQRDVFIDSSRVQVRIPHAEVSLDAEGKEYASYLLEVSHLAEEASKSEEKGLIPSSGWVISRRYNEFFTLHDCLKERYAAVRALEAVFPGKRFNGLLSAAFLESRRVSLQQYLQRLVKLEEVCNSRELKRFLSQSIILFTMDDLDEAASGNEGKIIPRKGLMSRLQRGMTGLAEGLEDLLFGPSMYEIVVQRLSTGVVDLAGFNEMEKILADATTSSVAEIKEAAQAVNKTSFTGPLCDAIIELFQLKSEGNWLRKQAVIIVAQQALGGTIEKRVRQSFAAALEPSSLLRYIALAKYTLWPNGELKKQSEQRRSLEEKRVRKENALKKLSTLIPSVASHFIGRDNARQAARMSWALLQNKRLNKHIIYTVLDKVLDELFEP